MVSGAPMSLISPPAAAGPAIMATDCTAWSLALPSPMCVRLDDVGQVALVGDVEEDRAAADRPVRRRSICGKVSTSSAQARGSEASATAAEQVVGHQHALLAPPVDPGAGRQPDDEEGEELAGPEQAHLEARRRRAPSRPAPAGPAWTAGYPNWLSVSAEEQLAEVVVPEQAAASRAGRFRLAGGTPWRRPRLPAVRRSCEHPDPLIGIYQSVLRNRLSCRHGQRRRPR